VGAAYVASYNSLGSTWSLTHEFVVSETPSLGMLGTSVSIAGDRVVAGALVLGGHGKVAGYVILEVEPDCNNNDVSDGLDICSGEEDCNENGVIDWCEYQPEMTDCKANEVWDACDLYANASEDCNDNGIPDECDITSGTSQDCNENGVPDSCDIADGTSNDCDSDGIPDECSCQGDLNDDGVVNVNDLLALLSDWGQCIFPCAGDIDCDGVVDVDDMLVVIANWGVCGGVHFGVPRSVQDCLDRFEPGSLGLQKCLEVVEYLESQGD